MVVRGDGDWDESEWDDLLGGGTRHRADSGSAASRDETAVTGGASDDPDAGDTDTDVDDPDPSSVWSRPGEESRPRPPSPSSGIRIVGATTAREAVQGADPGRDFESWSGAGAGAGLGHERAGAASDMPHWTDPPTGQVPAIFDRGDEDDPAWKVAGDTGPVWREEGRQWEDTFFEPSSLGDEETRVGALGDSPVEDRRPWEFDDLTDPVGVPAVAAGAIGRSDDEDDVEEERWAAWAGADAGADDRGVLKPAARGSADSPTSTGSADSSDTAAEEPAPRVIRTISSSPLRRTGAGAGAAAGGTGGTGSDAGSGVGGVGTTTRGGRGRRRGRGSGGGLAGLLAGERDLAGAPGAAGLGAGRPGGGAAKDEAEPLDPDDRTHGSDHGDEADPDRASLRPRPRRTPRGAASAGVGVRGAGATGEGAPGDMGRDLPTAVLIGLVLGGLFLLLAWAGPIPSLVLATAVVTLSVLECYAVLRRSGRRGATLVGVVATLGLMLAAYAKGPSAIPVILVIVVAATFVWYLAGVEHHSALSGLGHTLLGFTWIGVFGSYAALLLSPNQFPARHGVAFFVMAVVVTVLDDVGALFVGRWIGSHQFAPNVSARKTWEGLVGGAVLAVAGAVVLGAFLHPWTPGKAAVMGVAIAIVAPVGDLAESMFKRELSLKDTSTMLPGHGGVLDRFDALLFVLPLTYYLVRLLHLG